MRLFLPRFVADVEDYGLPSQVAMKVLRSRSYNADSMDQLLDRLMRSSARGLDGFELDMYQTFVEFL
jgi:hypothetical protein